MVQPIQPASDARSAYDALAPAYDALTDDYPYDRWLDAIERLARDHGACGRRVLDVACGTGKSFAPLLARGYEVTGCDLSADMLVRAARRAAGARLVHADMRCLGRLGSFDLITCLDDALNYLLTEEDLRSTLAGMARNLDAGGVVVFDVNTLATYRTQFATSWMADRGGFHFAWEGATPRDLPAGGIAEATVHISPTNGDRSEGRISRHRQRHWRPAEISDAAQFAGLHVAAVYGQRTGAHIDLGVDELVHTKTVYVAVKAKDRSREVNRVRIGRP